MQDNTEIEVGSWGANQTDPLGGTAVVQMRRPVENGRQVMNRSLVGVNPLNYSIVREEIPWSVSFANNGPTQVEQEATLKMNELPVPDPTGRAIPTALRIVDTSNGEGMVYAQGYPAKANGLNRAPNLSPTPFDERANPLDPPTWWTTKIKAKNKPHA